MRSFRFFVFFLLLVSCGEDNPGKANKKDIESLFEQANNDSIPLEKRINFARQSEKLTLELANNDSIKRKYLFKVANRYYNNGLYRDYRRVSGTAMEMAAAAQDSAGMGKACTFIRDYFIHEASPDSAYYFNSRAQKIFYALNDVENISETVLTQAVFQYQQSDYIRCEKTTIEALKFLRKTQNEELLYQAYNLLGLVYSQLGDHKSSKDYFDKALSIARRPYFSKERHLPSLTLNNLGLAYQNQNEHRKAIGIFESALRSENLKRDRPDVYATLLDNESYSKFKIGEIENLKDRFLAALEIRDSVGDVPAIISNKIHLSEFLLKRGETNLAKKFAREAEQLAKEKHQTREMLGVLRQLSKAYPEKALQYSEKYYKIDDSLEIAERKIQNKFARIEFETEELIIEKDKLVEQRKSLIYITLGIITLGVFIFVIRFQAAKNRELRLIQEQQQANEEVYQLMLNQQDRIEEVRQAEKKTHCPGTARRRARPPFWHPHEPRRPQYQVRRKGHRRAYCLYRRTQEC
ncbi:tetratricopeptide repeat protein [Flavobacterium sp. N1718]|uniref:tetratricopeptide repeat protein n=1 Tax=Flavobacterium sp. N1718 TaxID=2986822 RepID=UPI002224AC7E|nr:tetratricopeptide repeat protein [Flavobacterium sp. N1718]